MGIGNGDVAGARRGAADASSERLQSWKELAAYLKRGARTVQRWEREEGLPVRRLQHGKQGSIYGYKRELDAWWAARGAELSNAPRQPGEAMPSVAVMPFADLSAEKDQGYFCDGMAEEIVLALSRVSGLRVASADRRRRGRKTAERTVLEGSVRKCGDQRRIVVQLRDAESGFHLWSERFDRQSEDTFRVQDEIAGSVARAVAATLEIGGAGPTARDRARHCYRRGREFYYQYHPGAMEFAIQLFVRAIETDPEYAEAWAGLADCWSFTYLHAARSEELREQADWASLRAVEMDPRSAQANASRGVALSLDGRDEEARRAFEAALRLDGGLFEGHYYYARRCFEMGRSAEAAELYARAAEARPEDYQSPLLMAQILGDLGRGEDAAEARRLGVRRAEEHLKWNPDDARAMYLAANGLAGLGDAGRGRQLLERALAIRPEDPVLQYNAACTFALLGLTERALDALENAVRNGFWRRDWCERDSNLDCLRGHPRFEQMVGRMRGPVRRKPLRAQPDACPHESEDSKPLV